MYIYLLLIKTYFAYLYVLQCSCRVIFNRLKNLKGLFCEWFISNFLFFYCSYCLIFNPKKYVMSLVNRITSILKVSTACEALLLIINIAVLLLPLLKTTFLHKTYVYNISLSLSDCKFIPVVGREVS